MEIKEYIFNKENFEEEQINEVRVSDLVLDRLSKNASKFARPITRDKLKSVRLKDAEARKLVSTALAVHEKNMSEYRSVAAKLPSLKDEDKAGRMRAKKNLQSITDKLKKSLIGAKKAMAVYQREKNKMAASSSKEEWKKRGIKAKSESKAKSEKEKEEVETAKVTKSKSLRMAAEKRREEASTQRKAQVKKVVKTVKEIKDKAKGQVKGEIKTAKAIGKESKSYFKKKVKGYLAAFKVE